MKNKLENIINSLKQLAIDKQTVEFKDRNGNVYAIADFYEDENYANSGYDIEYLIVPARATDEIMDRNYYEIADLEDAAVEIYQSEQSSVDERNTIHYLNEMKKEDGKHLEFRRIDGNYILATYDIKKEGWILLKGTESIFESDISKAAKLIMRYNNETNIVIGYQN